MIDDFFYATYDCFQGDSVIIWGDEAHHILHVVRKQVGDEVVVVDGDGGWYRVRLKQFEKNSVTGIILERKYNVGEPEYELTLGIALIKHRNRFETMLEKLAELGVHSIVPMQTARTERVSFNEKRAQKILIAAMKQCRRSRLVQLHHVSPFNEIIENSSSDALFICHEKQEPADNIVRVLSNHMKNRQLLILLGPEGGFSDAEMAWAIRNNIRPVSLGPRRLRAETAAISAASAVMLIKEARVFE